MKPIPFLLVSASFLWMTSCVHPAADDSSGLKAQDEQPEGGATITAWTRGAGQYSDGGAARKNEPIRIQLHALPQAKGRLSDYQTGARAHYQSVPLQKVIAAYPNIEAADMVILHFSNGMIIPLPANVNDPVYSKLAAVVATHTSTDGKTWTSTFPIVSRKDPLMNRRDPVPIGFEGNKVVITGKAWPATSNGKFSPWRYVGSLTELEFVKKSAYYAQFAPSQDPQVLKGLQVFQERCQFCHGVRKVGASFGWDYVTPLPLHEKRNDETLYNHVHYQKLDQGTTIMPAQTDFAKDESQAIWEWMRSVAKNRLKAYAP